METIMCLAIPARIIEIEGARGRIELEGNIRDADLSLVEAPAVGDWVLVHAGFAIEKLDEEDAQETLKLFADMGNADER
jgi:hydrogenase expression/formation protein HypC